MNNEEALIEADLGEINDKTFLEIIKEHREIYDRETREVNAISKREMLQQRIAQLYLTGAYTNRQIADMLYISPNTVRATLKLENVRNYIEEYQREEKTLIDAKLKALRERALETFQDLLYSDEDTIRFNVAKDILARTGHAQPKETDININVTFEQKLKELANNADTSFLIDTDFVVD